MKVIHLLLCAAGIISASSILAQTAVPTSVPIEVTINMTPVVKVALTYNGVKVDGRFVLSTATENNIISDTLVGALQLPIEFSRSTGKSVVPQVQPDAVQLGSVMFKTPMKFLMVPHTKLISYVRDVTGISNIDGILGAPFFQQVPVIFNVPNLSITLFPSSPPLTKSRLAQYGFPVVSEAPLSAVRDKRLFSVEVCVNNKVSTVLIVDTIGGDTIIPTSLARELQLKPEQHRKIGGEVGTSACKVHVAVKIGSVMVPKVEVGYYDPSPPNGEASWSATLSMSVLAELNWLYDIPDKKLFLIQSVNTNGSTSPHIGMLLHFITLPFQAVVEEVEYGSLAEKAGLRAGDRILAIDGQEVSELTPDEAMRLLHPVTGKTLVLEVLHKGSSQPTEIRISIPK
jgi:hypothetical protein